LYTRESRKERISGWGNYPSLSAEVFRPDRKKDLELFLKNNEGTILARGGGTSYGDASINADGVNIDTLRLNHFLNFDEETGILRCQSGVRISELIETFLPRGWILNVTPGTMDATIGGCIACDAHGKNWKAGSFGNFVSGFNLMLGDGSVLQCDSGRNADLFYATIGGMGMTGIILDLDIRLKKVSSAYLETENIKFANLQELFEILTDSEQEYEYLFTWIDSRAKGKKLGRGILQRANHRENGGLALKKRGKIVLPSNLPSFLMNRLSIKAFNMLYYGSAKTSRNKKKQSLISHFYPLDVVGNWNRIYGRKGFLEYQIAIPGDVAFQAIEEILEIVARSKLGSTIAAVKPLTKSSGIMSFPIDGYTLVVDFPYSKKLFSLLDSLDRVVTRNGGRVYLVKDARLNASNFRQMYGESFNRLDSIRKDYGVSDSFNSLMFERLLT